jgi:hypothetical protein
MGYDMSIVGEMPEAERLAKEAAELEWNTAVAKRDAIGFTYGVDWQAKREIPEYAAAQKVVMAAYDKMNSADTHYFRLNIWGMGKARAGMYEAGMIFDGQQNDEWPTYSPPTSAEGGKEGLLQAEDDYDREYDALCEPIRAQHPDGDDTIPSFKFGSNDGWLVTPEECRAALRAWQEHKAKLDANDVLATYGEDGQEETSVFDAEWWPEWIEFIERASHRGGFKVW